MIREAVDKKKLSPRIGRDFAAAMLAEPAAFEI